jgi:glycosyltransferase involved in cell wall biosynthesis
MSKLKPQVTVVVPAFNESSVVLTQSLSSLASQSFSDFECLVIDESTDPVSAKACREFCEQDNRFRYVHPETRLGLAASLNLGIALAQGDLIARFDSDDVCMPDRLERQVAFMATHLNVGVLGGNLEIISENGNTLAFREYPAEHAAIERQFQITNSIAHPTVMVRKHIFDKFGDYDPSFRFSEDLELWLRLLHRGVCFANLQVVLVRYRQQTMYRNPEHFRFNIRARMRNFRLRQLPLRVLGICAIAAFCRLPVALQERVFHGLLFRHS